MRCLIERRTETVAGKRNLKSSSAGTGSFGKVLVPAPGTFPSSKRLDKCARTVLAMTAASEIKSKRERDPNKRWQVVVLLIGEAD
jgi:hypothetical protein